ncbi:monovalent cation/H(+) antiporter subunit G [Oscillibacter sp. MSJ-2]|uniref:Monovalent cation/H(+) antiporter subunit G n=1 Tax=Dysosmobacter acutus TaxID=2841504 RepID=A0ABS6FAD2_9FIRM|nr:monovalent cation/H(+) antiporter subunit G [Dysosmobacter acutus]
MTAIGIAFVLFGLFVFFTCVVGLYRLDYVLNRMHAAALCDALGIFSVLVGLIFLRGISMTGFKLGLILLFLWFTSPVASHLLAEMETATNPDLERECEVERR